MNMIIVLTRLRVLCVCVDDSYTGYWYNSGMHGARTTIMGKRTCVRACVPVCERAATATRERNRRRAICRGKERESKPERI